MKTVNIKGKEYVPVNERILEFRNNPKYAGYTMETNIIESDGNTVLMKTFIRDAQDKVVATGYAHELQSDGYINKTSHIENCETSSWGRALGNLGIGIDTGVASADEVTGAIMRDDYLTEKPDVWDKKSSDASKPVSESKKPAAKPAPAAEPNSLDFSKNQTLLELLEKAIDLTPEEKARLNADAEKTGHNLYVALIGKWIKGRIGVLRTAKVIDVVAWEGMLIDMGLSEEREPGVIWLDEAKFWSMPMKEILVALETLKLKGGQS